MTEGAWSEAIDRMLSRIRDTAARVKDGFPHWADPETGQWTTTPHGDWTGGCWIGMLWLAAAATGDARYRAWAEPVAERLRARVDAETVFKAFPAYYGAALGAILHDAAGPRDIAVATARSLARLYAPALRLVPLGAGAEEGGHIGATETSIDSLQAATLLFWAAGVTGDQMLREVATNHAETIIHLHLRPDGSFIQSSSLDPATGRLVRHYTHKGVSDTSTWGRAQAWGMLFSTQSYLADRSREAWIGAAVRGADWWLEHAPPDRVAYWDFDDPDIPNTERDTAATAIATAALLKLSRVAPSESGRARYREAAEATARALVDRYLTPTHPGDRRVPGMLTEACFNKRTDARPQDRANRCEFIVGSYYLFESLLGLAGRIDPLRV
ncbi:MAG TPA: glycosyl hydrolase [Methylomirabilota bacterium]|jgi:unsaturated chondroitin disaccharide hydrolase|nr:glycosyl hydrolase [Methylomirabilota bacterium]